MPKKVKLFYWSSKVFEKKDKENYGDLLSPYIVAQVSNNEVEFYNAPASRKKFFKKDYLMAIGSILQYATSRATVWGSGIISKNNTPGKACYCAVRGPLSRKRIQELGHTCPEVYGDPALLLPEFYHPTIAKTEDIGIVPHYVDYKKVQKDYGKEIKVIDLMTDNWQVTTDQILSCKAIISSSLHGVIVAHAYGIPAIWVQFSNKLSGDNVKYADYFLSVGIEPYEAPFIDQKVSHEYFKDLIASYASLPDKEHIENMTTTLKEAFPVTHKKAS